MEHKDNAALHLTSHYAWMQMDVVFVIRKRAWEAPAVAPHHLKKDDEI